MARPPRPRAALALLAFAGLLFQVAATRQLYILFDQSSHSVSAVLSCYLLGLAGGSALFGRWRHRFAGGLAAPGAALALGLALYGALVLARLDHLLLLVQDWVAVPRAPVGAACVRLLLASLFLAAPTLILGALFPLLFELVRRADRAREDDALPGYYAIDLLASALGTLLTGFVLIPSLGVHWTIALGAALAALAAWLTCPSARVAGAAALALAAATGLGPRRAEDPGAAWVLKPSGSAGLVTAEFAQRDLDVVWSTESPFGQLTVVDRRGPVPAAGFSRALFVNRRQLCHVLPPPAHPYRGLSEAAIADDALTLAKANRFPRHHQLAVADIGLGCGVTLAMILDHREAASVDVLEINPRMSEAAAHFAAATGNPLGNPRVRLTIDNAWLRLAQPGTAYDVMIVDVEEPAVQHSSALYTREFFARAKARLAPGGIFALWSYAASEAYHAILHRTLSTEFAHVLLREKPGSPPYYLASDTPLKLGALDVTDTELLRSQRVSRAKAPVNTLDRAALLEAWLASTGRDPKWR